MAIDLATKSSSEFKYTHEGLPFRDTSTFRAIFAHALRSIERSASYDKSNLRKRDEIEMIVDDKINRRNYFYRKGLIFSKFLRVSLFLSQLYTFENYVDLV